MVLWTFHEALQKLWDLISGRDLTVCVCATTVTLRLRGTLLLGGHFLFDVANLLGYKVMCIPFVGVQLATDMEVMREKHSEEKNQWEDALPKKTKRSSAK